MSEVPEASLAPVATAFVAGAIELPPGIILPEDAVVTVAIEDISLADAPAEVVAEATPVITDPTALKIPYEVAYDPALIEETNTYAVRATIEDAAGELLYTSDTVTPVITNDAPTADVDVVVVPAPSETPGASAAAVVASPDPY